MARIQDELLGCVFFVYPSRAEADTGSQHGASGFFVGIDWDSSPHRRHVYAVTNKHVIMSCRDNVVIRVTRLDGQLDFIETDPIEWHPSRYHDISVRPIEHAKAALFQNVPDGMFVIRENFEGTIEGSTCLGPGDEVFMIGRFISHDGREKNHPSTRFGNLSMLPAPIRHPGGYDQESFAVEMRSISGYSGSPAFIYWEFGGSQLSGINRPFHKSFLGLLGVDWGHIPMQLPVLKQNGKPHDDKLYVKSHTSMSGVVPSWHLRELLESAELKGQRMKDEKDEASNQIQKDSR